MASAAYALLGVAQLVPWHAYLKSVPFLAATAPGDANVGGAITSAYTAANCAAAVVVLVFRADERVIGTRTRILAGMAGGAAVLAAAAAVSTGVLLPPGLNTVGVLCGLTACAGVFNALTLKGDYVLAARSRPALRASFLAGQCSSGLLMSLGGVAAAVYGAVRGHGGAGAVGAAGAVVFLCAAMAVVLVAFFVFLAVSRSNPEVRSALCDSANLEEAREKAEFISIDRQPSAPSLSGSGSCPASPCGSGGALRTPESPHARAGDTGGQSRFASPTDDVSGAAVDARQSSGDDPLSGFVVVDLSDREDALHGCVGMSSPSGLEGVGADKSNGRSVNTTACDRAQKEAAAIPGDTVVVEIGPSTADQEHDGADKEDKSGDEPRCDGSTAGVLRELSSVLLATALCLAASVSVLASFVVMPRRAMWPPEEPDTLARAVARAAYVPGMLALFDAGYFAGRWLPAPRASRLGDAGGDPEALYKAARRDVRARWPITRGPWAMAAVLLPLFVVLAPGRRGVLAAGPSPGRGFLPPGWCDCAYALLVLVFGYAAGFCVSSAVIYAPVRAAAACGRGGAARGAAAAGVLLAMAVHVGLVAGALSSYLWPLVLPASN